MTQKLKNFRRWFKKWRVPIFFGLTSLVIIIFNDVFGEEEIFAAFAFLFFALMFFVFLRWFFRQIKSILKLKKEKKQAELLHLKSQVNPHFFFNTLNNLYGLVEKDSTQAQALILKLSDMMRYSIYDGQKDLVTLGEEITYLENYIDLHRMRYHKTIDVKFKMDIKERQIKVMPLLFIILLENAFKHGVENLRSDAFIDIHLKSTFDNIDFEIKNNFNPQEEQIRKGIGLENLKRRLDLVYTNRHSLKTKIEKDIYTAQLNLQL